MLTLERLLLAVWLDETDPTLVLVQYCCHLKEVLAEGRNRTIMRLTGHVDTHYQQEAKNQDGTYQSTDQLVRSPPINSP